ncbi:hypothetical protein HAX54_008866 [Datura stramonium]|uniref:MADS-box domain-containing protein n=1 Tax=Datura stramonium TaxID=4076 RepID=A0ABS8TFE0_DATST|nr:hypothetical protein [Datura stramonium]
MENKEEVTKKRSRGRQKIPIQKITNKKSLPVTFSKRKTGLFKKASALTALYRAEVAVIVESPAGNLFSFGNPSVDSVIHRFETGGFGGPQEDGFNFVIGEYSGKSNWWEDVCLENLGLQELEECMSAMEVLKKNLLERADDLGMANSSSDVLIPNGALPLQYYDDLGGRSN